MKIRKVLNSSVVLAEDEQHQEFILLAKGIGYGRKPGEVLDDVEDKEVFIPVENSRIRQVVELINSLPPTVLELAKQIVEESEQFLGVPLASNLVFILADHLNFALERLKNGMVITNRVFWEIKNFYPKEFEAGQRSLKKIEETLNVALPKEEAANIAFHLANGEAQDNPDYDAARYAKLTGEIINVVRYSLNRDFDQASVHYLRFVTHIKFFAERFFTDHLLTNEDTLLFEQMKRRYPKEMVIAEKVRRFLADKYGKRLPDEELTFLVIHISRLEKSQTTS